MGPRRLVITICSRETGAVSLAVRAGETAQRLDAAGITRALRDLAAERGLAGRVRVVDGCAGGCGRPGPNVGVTFHAMPRPGEKPDHVALGWRTYVYSLASLDCVAAILDQCLAETAPDDPPTA